MYESDNTTLIIDVNSLHPNDLVPLLQLLQSSRQHAVKATREALNEQNYEAAAHQAVHAADLSKAITVVDTRISR
jgi:hypothetical protein